MNKADQYIRPLVHLNLTRSVIAKLIALYRNDTALAAKAEQGISTCRNMIAELDASGAARKFGAGGTVGEATTLKMPDGGEGIVAGWASTSDLDHYGHRIMAGAFSQSISERGLTGPRAVKLLLDHDWTRPAGVIRELGYRGNDLWIEAQLALDIEYVRDRYSVIKLLNGFNFSVAFILQDYEIKTDPLTKDEYLQINRGDLFEVSVVAFPGNENATAHEIRSAPQSEVATIEQMLVKLHDLKRALR